MVIQRKGISAKNEKFAFNHKMASYLKKLNLKLYATGTERKWNKAET